MLDALTQRRLPILKADNGAMVAGDTDSAPVAEASRLPEGLLTVHDGRLYVFIDYPDGARPLCYPLIGTCIVEEWISTAQEWLPCVHMMMHVSVHSSNRNKRVGYRIALWTIDPLPVNYPIGPHSCVHMLGCTFGSLLPPLPPPPCREGVLKDLQPWSLVAGLPRRPP